MNKRIKDFLLAGLAVTLTAALVVTMWVGSDPGATQQALQAAFAAIVVAVITMFFMNGKASLEGTKWGVAIKLGAAPAVWVIAFMVIVNAIAELSQF